jgi:hypothetical protein
MVDRQNRFEQEIQVIANDFSYPATPNVAQAVTLRLRPQARTSRLLARKLAWTMVIIAVLAATLMLVPPVRAAVLEWIQIGVVRIFPPAPRQAPTSLPGERPGQVLSPVTATPNSATATPPATPATFSLLNLAGETTLTEAQAQVSFPILVPSYPPELGLPDRVYLQEQSGPMLVLIWLDHANPDRVRLSLHTLARGSWGIDKMQPRVIQKTTVNGQAGVWAEGPYFLQLRNLDYEMLRLIEGHVLIWTQDNLTYRLETDLPLEEAIRVAESLTPIPAGTP